MNTICVNCKFGDFSGQIESGKGYCRRHAPLPTVGDDPQNVSWPLVNDDDFCAEFQGVRLDDKQE